MSEMEQNKQFKEAFKGVNLPPIDVRQHVMGRIYQKEREFVMFRGKKLFLAIVLSVVLIFSVGYAAATIINLQGPGNMLYQYLILDEKDTFPPREVYQDRYDKLEPGYGLAIMRVKDNENNKIHTPMKPHVFTDVNAIAEIVGEPFLSPQKLPQGYQWKEGNVTYNLEENIELAQDMIDEKKNSDEDYIFRLMKPDNTVHAFNLTYTNNQTEMLVQVVYNWSGGTINVIGENASKPEKINVKDFEAVYVEEDGKAKITWLDGTTYYSIHMASTNSSTREDLLLIAESLE